MDRDLVVTVDVGTTATKTMLWDAAVSHPLASHSHEYALAATSGRIECDAEVYLDAVTAGIRAVVGGDAVAARVRALTFTTQGETLVLVDEHDRAVGPAIVWLDTRADAEAAELALVLPADVFRSTTGLPELDGALPLAKALLLARAHPAVLARGGAVLLLEDYLLAQLTGRRVTTPSLQTSTGWFDLAADDYWDDALRAAELNRRHLALPVPSGSVVGALKEIWSARLGLPGDVTVVAGAMDQVAASLGSGTTRPGTANVTFGTALSVAVTTSTLPDARAARLTVYRHAIEGRYLVLEFLPTGAALLAWLRRIVSEAAHGDLDYDRLDELASAVAPGSDGVVALPQFEGGLVGAEGRAASGGFLGLSIGVTIGHLARSLMESTAYVLDDVLASFVRAGIAIADLRTSGGGARSAVWQQIVADVTGRELTRLSLQESTSRGAALLACWGSGLLAARTDPAHLAGVDIAPDPSHREVYDAGERRYRSAASAVRTFWADAGSVPSLPAVTNAVVAPDPVEETP